MLTTSARNTFLMQSKHRPVQATDRDKGHGGVGVWRKLWAALSLSLTLASPVALAQQATLTAGTLEFDNFSHGVDAGSTAAYGGFTWGSKWWESTPDANKPLTFDNSLSTTSVIRRTDGSQFVFDGATFWKRAADKNIDVTVSLFGANSSTALSTTTFQLQYLVDAHGVDTRTFLNSAYTGLISFMTVSVDKGTVKGNDQNYLALDTFRFQAASLGAGGGGTPVIPSITPAVPEPGMAGLMGTGLAVLVVVSRRRRSAAQASSDSV